MREHSWFQALLRRVFPLVLMVGARGATFPEYKDIAAGALRVQALPGRGDFVFTMYGTPGGLGQVKELVTVMKEQHLGNGFDPGPAARPVSKPVFDYLAGENWPVVAYPGCADMQIKDGRCVLGPEDKAALDAFERAGVFNGVQLGEWGYYFHNLSPNERWWRDVYGPDFDQMKHLMKPPGLAGYDTRPASRRECYDVLQELKIFTSRSRDLLDRVVSVTGHSHYESYAAEWGARCIGLELGENIAFTQSKIAFARGASRQWEKPWSVQVSPWFHGACTTSGPLRREGKDARGLDAGHSLSFFERMCLHAWFAGAAMVTPENSLAIFFEQPAAPWSLTSHGRKASEVFQFMRTHERGVPWTPVAIVLDHYAGYNGYMDKPWGILPPTAGDRETRDLFDFQLFPGSDHIHMKADPTNPEASYLRPTSFGESFDVLLTSVKKGILTGYPVILLAGDIEFDDAFVARLEEALKGGRTMLVSARHKHALADRFERLSRAGRLEVLEPWTNPVTDRPAAISAERLQQITSDNLPMIVSGDAVQSQVNRIPGGWVVELVNNGGVIKKPDQPAVTDALARRRAVLKPKAACSSARAWRSGRVYPNPALVEVELEPGATEFVEFIQP